MDKTRDFLVYNLKKLREKSGMTQSEAAEAIGISLSGYAKMEYGENWVAPETMDSIAKAFKTSPSALLQNNVLEPQKTDADLIVSIMTLLPALDHEELRIILGQVETAASAKSVKMKAK